jgi:Macrocin-O-methyltransferase (TylF)
MPVQPSEQTITPGKGYASAEEADAYDALVEMSKRSPLPEREVLANLGMFHVRPSFARMLFMHKLYLKALETHGVIMEFGVRWGQNMALFTTFRNMYEPYNMSRRIVGFDTFEGFPSVHDKDGAADTAQAGALSVSADYEDYLGELLSQHERLGPRSHIKKHELVKGDVVETLPTYLEQHPETIIALAYFDLDLYEPTKKCLELIKPHLARNSVVGFDELVLNEFPGETTALKEAWGLSGFEIMRDPISPQQSYLVMG